MIPEELLHLLDQYRDGEISPADARRLAEAIRAGDETAELLRRDLALTGQLAQALADPDGETFVRSFTERVNAEQGGADFVRAFEKRASARLTARLRPAPSPWASAMPALVAAGIFLTLLALLASQSRSKPEGEAPPQARHEPLPLPEPEPRIDPVPLSDPAPAPVAPTPEEPRKIETPPPAPAPTKQPERSPAPPPARVVEKPKPEAPKATEVAAIPAALLDRAEGQVFLTIGNDRKPAASGTPVPAGAIVTTGSGNSRASLVLPDGTRIGLGADSVVREISRSAKGARIVLGQGSLAADVAKQPPEQPLVFATPHGEARVLGTVLRLVVDFSMTRLEVKEGKVALAREGKNVTVSAGQVAIAAAGTPLAARSASPDEIVLLAAQAKLTGNEWTLGRDPKGMSGVVLEVASAPYKPVDHVEARPSYATLTFYAPADKEYRLWLRVTSVEKGDAWTRDLVTVEPTRATLNQKSPFFGASPTNATVVTGIAATPGYTWISIHGEEGKADGPPLTVRFNETGLQNIRLYGVHPWVKVDAIWLSATQKTRPPAKLVPTPSEK